MLNADFRCIPMQVKCVFADGFHFIRKAVDDNKITLEHRRTKDMLADLFTKALLHPRLEHLSALFGLRSL